VSRGPILVFLLAVVVAAGCGGGSGGPSDAQKRASLATAEKEMNTQAYDDALKRVRALGDWDGAPKKLIEFRKRAARETLANAKTKNLKKAPRAAMSLAKTSLKYWRTDEAQAFYNKASAAHDTFKKKRQAAGHF
jgi:hypothetical protein